MRKLSWVILSVYLWIQLLLQPTQAANDTETAKCPSSQFTCKNEKCIPQSWYCDNDDDCDDGSDESDCRIVTCAQDHFQCTSGKCIPQRWHCDHENDCDDGSDENAANCEKKTCKADQFACKTGACIPEGWKCDGQNDCTDGDDEHKEQCDVAACAEGEFQCANGRCISERWKCDQDNDCGDDSDELKVNCPGQNCDEDEFQCANMICIKSSWRCDGDFDCNDNSDELNCNSTENKSKCSSSEFTCQDSKECIHVSWKCDGEHDCEDGSDEKSDCHITCRPDQFMCEKDSYCIHKVLSCDGNEDCLDGSDEKNCSKPQGCSKDEFDCLKDGSKCIPLSKVCDKTNDCGNFEDESTELECSNNPCEHKNGDCSQICVNLYGNKHRCECKKGFEFAPNSTTMCQDVDECKIPGWCSQECTNLKGTYKCNCMEGYSLVQHRYCRADGDSAELLLANSNDLRRINIENHKRMVYTLLVEDEKVECAISVDYDITNNKVYWSDVKLEQILSADMSNKSKVVPVAKKMVSTPDGIAVDWIHGNLYWTDAGYDTIEVSALDGKFRRLLIDSDLDEPRAIVVDPHNAYMYWTDWGRTPKIEKCGMDGTDRKTIIQDNILWPNGITIDYVDNRLYWVDAKLHIIASADLDGGFRRTVHASEVVVRHPFGITVFEDSLYWTDWRSESIHKINKFGKGNVTSVVMNLNEPMDVHIFHKYRQPKYNNLCGANNGECEQFCLPSPKGLTGPRHTCACNDGYELADNKKNCTKLANTTEETVRTPPANHAKGSSPNKTKHRRWHLMFVNKTHEGVNNVPSATTPKSGVHEVTSGNEQEIVVSTEDNTGYNIATTTDNSTQVKMPVNKQPEENVGQVAIIVIAVIVGIGIIGGIVVYVIVKRLKRKNMKSMNFDNPVYRKTTEDQFSIDKDAKNPSLQPLNPPTNEIV